MPQKRYEYLPHTADAKFRAYGQTLEEAFGNAALAIFNLLVDTEKVESRLEHKVSLTARGKESLLFDFLSELLFLIDAENFLLAGVDKVSISEESSSFKLEATLLGDNLTGYDIHGQVKAVTYHEMVISEDENGWALQVVVDV
ncbi:MAG: archease [bacterium]|nr:archease [bacterium]